MFICDKCKRTSSGSANNKVTKTRDVNCRKVIRDKEGKKIKNYNTDIPEVNKMYDSTKIEIAKEEKWCNECMGIKEVYKEPEQEKETIFKCYSTDKSVPTIKRTRCYK